MIRCALPESFTGAVDTPRDSRWSNLLEHDLRIDDAAGADHAHLARQHAARDLPDLPRLPVGDDRVPGVRPALVAAHDVRLLGEQVDDLALALVTPLRADDHGRRHDDEVCPIGRLVDRRNSDHRSPSTSKRSTT
jgi:hypothetical protein